jgi:tetratricopeptide (TPR) repeat protein/tRNA A-37 threonylcarbamoyl transferase component Bud32
MGTVYLAEDTHLGRRVAIKFPSINSDSHDYRARFLREARSVSELSHPGIATLFDYGETQEGRPFLVMELAKGRPLAELFRKGELNLARAVAITAEVAAALVEAHARGVVHRDIKPSNIMIDDNGQVKVLDFGLAKQINREHTQGSEPEARTLLSTDTQSGVVLGTPAYLSPEQATSGAIDGRSDLFSLGTLLYEAITGRTPFAGKSFIEIAANVLHVEPAAPSKLNPRVPRELDFIVMKALAKKPSKRYQSAKELISDLNAVKEKLEDSEHTLIKRSASVRMPGQGKTLSNLSQILQRPRIPISYILIGAAVLIVAGGLAFRFARPAVHTPPAEAQRWYDVGTTALRDGAYSQASQALERAIAVDNDYVLAHARLAEALVELDYVDKAKDELLHVNSTDRAALPKVDALYLDAITATARLDSPKAIALYKQIVNEVAENEKAYVLVDLGRAYENNNDVKGAIDSYQEASKRNSQFPTPYLRLGILYGQQGDLATALQSFAQADSIYQALGKLEGRAEVIFQRGTLYNKRNKLAEAKADLEQALTLANANNNKSQTIKTLLQLSSVAFDAGETARSTEYAQQAVTLAQENGMENLSTRGLVDLGQSFLVRGKQAEAEKYLEQALALAERSKARRNEARARVALAGLRQQQNRPDDAVKYLEPALAFYQQGGYRSEAFSCLALLARANLQKGDYLAADKGHEELLRLAQELNDQSLTARAHAERGSSLAREEKFTEALDHLNQAYSINSAQGIQRSMGYNLENRGEVLSRLGRFDEAKALLAQANAIATKPGGELKRLSVEGDLALAQLMLMQEDFPSAKAAAQKVAEAGKEFRTVVADAKVVIGLAEAYSGAKAAAQKTMLEAVDLAKQLNDPAKLATAQWAQAVVALLAGDSGGASSYALQAEEVFARLGQSASQWQAQLITAQAGQNLGDKNRAREYAMKAKDTLSKLEQRWGSENYRTYLSRPDIQRSIKQLEQLTGSV